jgi:hypothetical protein
MASMAKNASKNLVSYAEVASGKGVKSSFFAATVCDIKIPRNVPNKRIPNTDEKYSFFVDLLNIKATEEEVANAITLDGILGVKYRPDLAVVEFVCDSDEIRKKALQMEFEVKGKGSFSAIAPRHLLQRTVLVKIANMDFGEEALLKELLSTYWSQYGEVIDAAPHKLPGKPWLTQRWDILLTLPEQEKKLKAPVVFNLEGSKRSLLATWPGAPKSCLKCLIAGHATSKCPGKNPKAGGCPDPEKKDRQEKTKKGKNTKTVLGGSAGAPVPPETKKDVAVAEVAVAEVVADTMAKAEVEAETVAAVAYTAATTSEVAESGDSLATGPELQTDKEVEEMQVLRMELVTPPPPDNIEDPDTPRKGNKRMSKTTEVWTPTGLQVIEYIGANGICVRCWTQKHSYLECPNGKPVSVRGGVILQHPKFQPFLQVWIEKRRKKGKATELQLETELSTERLTIQPYCTECWKKGHVASNCPLKQ